MFAIYQPLITPHGFPHFLPLESPHVLSALITVVVDPGPAVVVLLLDCRVVVDELVTAAVVVLELVTATVVVLELVTAMVVVLELVCSVVVDDGY